MVSEDKFTTYELAQRIVSDVRRGDMGVVGLEAALNALASQVWEQREKCSHPHLDGITPRHHLNKIWHCQVCDGLFFWEQVREGVGEHVPATIADAIKELNEAAELALQTETKQRGLDRLEFTQQVMDREREKETLRAALQAKEQELAELKRMVTVWAEQKAADIEIESAQARQQAVAEGMLFQFLRMKKERPIDPIYWDAHEEKNLREAVRSLTPPPALTCKHLERWEHANGMICKGCGATL